MTQETYIDYFKAKAAKLGNTQKRFSEFYPDEIFLPDISAFKLDLRQMCMLVGFYEMSIGGNLGSGFVAGNYRCRIMLIRATKMNDYADQKAAIVEAETLALQLYMSCVEDQCNNFFGYCFDNVKLDERPWNISPVPLLHDQATGVDVSFNLKQAGNYDIPDTTNPFLI